MSDVLENKRGESGESKPKEKSKVTIDRLVLGPFQTNTYIVSSTDTGQAVVIDPGFQGDRIAGLIKERGLKLEQILLTHGHVDHVSAVGSLLKSLGMGEDEIPIAIHEEDVVFLESAPEMALAFGLSVEKSVRPGKLLQEGDIIKVGELSFRTLHTPGHTPGGVSFVMDGEGAVFVGDTLFQRSIGRTDLPGGSYSVLEASIREKLYSLDPSMKVYTGHGPTTTIREEQRSNPFVTI